MIPLVKKNVKALLYFVLSIGTIALGEPLFHAKGMRRGASLPPLPEVQRILVLRLDQIGDVVMTSPLLRELRRNAPQAWITLIVKPEIQELVSACPYVDEVLTFDWNTPTHLIEFRRRIRALKFCVTYLWSKNFDLAIIPRWDVDTYCHTFLAYFSGSRWRVGYSEDVSPIKQSFNRGYDRLLTLVLHQSAVSHEVERNLAVLRALGGTVHQTDIEVWTTPDDDLWARNLLEAPQFLGLSRFAALGPFVGGSPLKKWPLQNFIDLGRQLQDKYGVWVLVLGSSTDYEQAQQVCAGIGQRSVSLAGQCSLRQIIALLKQCSLYVGTDSGPMHLASAAGTPMIALFGPSCPHRFEPWMPKKHLVWKELPCSPCITKNHADCCSVCIFPQPKCIQSISVAEVMVTVQKADYL